MRNSLLSTLSPCLLSQEIQFIFNDLNHLGILQSYGSYCLFISSLLCEILNKKNIHAHILSCTAIVDTNQRQFLIGHPGYGKPGQMEAHFVCIVENKYLIDFSMANVQKYFDENFAQGVVLPLSYKEDCLGEISIPNQFTMQWKKESSPPDLAYLLKQQQHHLDKELSRYVQYRESLIELKQGSLLTQPLSPDPILFTN